MYLLNSFLVYSILGWVFEMLFGTLIGASTPKSGVLYGPWTPIYGIASVLIIIISTKLFKNLHLKRWQETIIVFLIITIVLMFLEWLGGTLIELIFGFSFWDYSDFRFVIGKYTCLEVGAIWGIIGIIFIYIIRPFLDDFVKKIPWWLTIIMLVLIIFDLTLRLMNEFKII